MRYTIKRLIPDGTCEVSGKSGDVIVVESDDGLRDAMVSFLELQKMVRFRAIQEQKQNGSPTPTNRIAGLGAPTPNGGGNP